MKINIPLPFDRLGVGDEFLTADAVAEIGKTVLGGISSPGEQWTPESILDKIGRLHELGVSAVGVSATAVPGASGVTVALILIDARKGVLEQTRRRTEQGPPLGYSLTGRLPEC
jgi:hypothetical protein